MYKTFKSFALFAAICVVAVLFGELISRALLWSEAPETDVGDVRVGLRSDGLGDLHPGQNGVYITRYDLPYHVRSNAQGFRNRQDLDEKAYRILALGDSQTFGLFVNAQDVWSDWLEHRLRANGRAVQVLNNGIPGAGIRDELDYFITKGTSLDADIVILCVYVNDVADSSTSDTIRAEALRMNSETGFADIRWFLRTHSALYAAAKAVKTQMIRQKIKQSNQANTINIVTEQTPSASVPKLPFNKYEADFRKLAAATRKDGAKLMVAFLPGPRLEAVNSRIGNFISELCESESLPFLDLTPAISSRSLDEVYLYRVGDSDYPSDIHLSRTGHMLVAEALSTFVIERAAIP